MVSMACTRRRRIATSEAVGTLLTIAITLITGSAVWGYINVQAGTSELSYANTVGGTDNFLAENFKVSDISFSTLTAKGGSCTSGYCSIVFYLYNVGLVSDQISQVRLSDTAGQVNILYNFTKTGSGGQFQFVGNYLYATDARGNLVCMDFKTGEVKWSNPSVGTASLCFADGLLYVRGQGGNGFGPEKGPIFIALVEPTPDGYKERGRFEQPDHGKKPAWPHPVVANGRLYLRDLGVLMCYDVKDAGSGK